MNPLSLHATAYRTYSDLTLDFPCGVCAITGEIAGEPGKSNGSGKSSIANAIDLALFGAQSRTLADEHNPAFGETMLLEFVFEHAGETYKVRRTYSAKGRGITTVDLERQWSSSTENGHGLTASTAHAEGWEPLTRESAAATQEYLQEILGLSRPTFRASSFLAQGDGDAFTKGPAGKRMELLRGTLGLEVWDRLRARAKAEKKATELRLANVEGMIARAEPEIAQRAGLALQLDQARENEQTAQASLIEATARLGTAREALAEARGRVERRAGAEKSLQRAEADRVSFIFRLAGHEDSLRTLEERLTEREGLQVLVEGMPGLVAERERLAEHAQRFAERERLEGDRATMTRCAEGFRLAEASLYDKSVKVLEGIGSETCDRCGQTLHAEAAHRAAESYGAEANEHSFRANNIEEHDLVTLNEKISALPAAPPDAERAAHVHDLIQLGQNAQTKLAALDEAQTRRDELAAEIHKMRAELPEREQDVATTRADLQALGPHDIDEEGRLVRAVHVGQGEEAEARRRIDEHTRDIARLEERLARLDTLAGEVHLATQEREQLHQEQELLTALERAFGPNGIPAFIVENTAIPQIEAEACRILRDLGTEYQVELHTQRETKAGGVTDALDIVVYDGIRARPYEGFSGGEKTRIELALRIALAHLLANRRGAESRVLVIDEPDGLDSAGMAALADVLRRLNADGVFEKVLLVSHVAELRDAFEASIHVVCENGVSWVEGAREMVTA